MRTTQSLPCIQAQRTKAIDRGRDRDGARAAPVSPCSYTGMRNPHMPFQREEPK